VNEIKGETEFHVKFRIGDEHKTNINNQFQINYILEDDFYD